MEKQVLNKFIQKYNLSGIAESVRWESASDTLQTTFISGDKCLLGMVSVSDVDFPSGEFGIYDTSKLIKILTVLDENLNIELSTKAGGMAESIKFKGGSISANYMLSGLNVIPNVPEMKMIPEFDVEIPLDSHFIDTFIKAKNALSDEQNFTLEITGGNASITIGTSDIVSNRIRFGVDSESADENVSPISFNAEHLKNILLANREVSNPTLNISTQGLAMIRFEFGNYTSKYYLVQTNV